MITIICVTKITWRQGWTGLRAQTSISYSYMCVIIASDDTLFLYYICLGRVMVNFQTIHVI